MKVKYTIEAFNAQTVVKSEIKKSTRYLQLMRMFTIHDTTVYMYLLKIPIHFNCKTNKQFSWLFNVFTECYQEYALTKRLQIDHLFLYK